MLCIKTACGARATAYFNYGNVICPMCDDHLREALVVATRGLDGVALRDATRKFKRLPTKKVKHGKQNPPTAS